MIIITINLLALFLSVFIAGILIGILFSPSARKVVQETVSETVSSCVSKLRESGLLLSRSPHNPTLAPGPYQWESAAVLNPAAFEAGGRVHLLYRAVGTDGVSRIGYASSRDGMCFDVRLPYPVYTSPNLRAVPRYHRRYQPAMYPSGGSWGGCEDPRAVKIDRRVYVTYNAFDGWDFIRTAITSISEKDLLAGHWRWSPTYLLSRPGERHKNWVLFPERIHGKFAVLHNINAEDEYHVLIEYFDNIDIFDHAKQDFESPDPLSLPDAQIQWHYRMRSAGPPPIKTPEGWLLLYHAMDTNDPYRYKLGAMLLDTEDPTKVLHRAPLPILEPNETYENEGKPGIVYACGAVILQDTLYVYYGGGDRIIAVATAPLTTFLDALVHEKQPSLTSEPVHAHT